MQRYIYGDLNKAGYQTASSDAAFFTAHAKALAKLMYYDTGAKHGDLPQDQHKSFWMLTTDLMALDGKSYLFLQESGMDPHRLATVVQGYRSDPEERELYGPEFLRLFDTRFLSSGEALALAETEPLQAVSVEELPREEIRPAALQGELLEGIILALFQEKRVIIRLNSEGAAAMAESKAFLKAIYQRLPYEIRRNTGCLTGATLPCLKISKAFRIILMDGDADITGIRSSADQTLFDLRTGVIPKAPESELGRFLALETPENLDRFYSFCEKTLKAENVRNPGLSHYELLLAWHTLGDKPVAGEKIRQWAVNLWDGEWLSKDSQKEIRAGIAASMAAEDLTDYLKAAAPDYEDLFRLGKLSRADKERDRNAQRDQNGALTLRMMLSLPRYDTEAVRKGLAEHFVAGAERAYPCLTEEKPTKATVKELGAIQLPPKQEHPDNWPTMLLEDVRSALESRADTTRRVYLEEYQRQQSSGEARIAAWTGDQDLTAVYQSLETYYLREELIADWNEKIAQRITEECRRFPEPGELSGYEDLRERENCFRECFQAHGGTFTAEQSDILEKLARRWKEILELCGKTCSTAKALESWLLQVDKAGMAPELAMAQKREKASALLSVIPKELPMEETKQRLKSSQNHPELLEGGIVRFEPWGVTEKAGKLLEQIEKLERYTPGTGAEPKLDNPKVCFWIATQLPENQNLMILLIRKFPGNQKKLVDILAKKGKTITTGNLRELYLEGCSWKCLREAGGEEMSDAWRGALEKFLPDLPSLPAPMEQPEGRRGSQKSGMMLVVQVLFALAGLVPGAAILAFSTGTVLSCGLLTAGLAVIAAVFLTVAVVTKSKGRKRFLVGLGLAMIPGTLMAAAALVMCLI